MPRFLTSAAIQEFREAFCDAAFELFSEVGRDGFNMRELAKKMGVSTMTPYRYFRDKNEILDMVRTRAFSRLADQLEATMVSEKEFFARSLALSSTYVRFAHEEEGYYRLMFDLSVSGNRSHSGSYPEEDRVRTVFERHACQLTRLDFDAPLCKIIGQLMFVSLHGTVSLYLSGRLAGQVEKVAADNLYSITINCLSDPTSRFAPFCFVPSADEQFVHRQPPDGGTLATNGVESAMGA